jgi:hypothetical protein
MFTTGVKAYRDIPSPWSDLATASMPTSHSDALAWSEYIYEQHPTFRQAMERRISYFLTDLEIASATNDRGDIGDDEKQKRLDILRNDLDVLGIIQQLSRERVAYGNGFVSLYEPFQRNLHCGTCQTMYPLRVVGRERIFAFKFTPRCEFVFTCPKCQATGAANVVDTPENDPSKFRLHIWSPKEIELAHDLISGKTTYFWRIPNDYKQRILKGSLPELLGANREMLDAIRDNCRLFEFDENVIFHLKEPTLSGMRNNGWGISEVFRNYREIWFTQLLRCHIEAFAVDYVVPLRIITPDVRNGAGGMSMGKSSDPFMTMDMGGHNARIAGMMRNKRFDPAQWNFLPFPVRSTLLGGDANQLIPRELYDQAVESMLNATGTPVELYRGTLRLETAMVGLRLYESTNFSLVQGHNNFLRWLMTRLSSRVGWSPMRLTMKRVTYADDFNISMLMAQLMMQQQMSRETFFKSIGADAKNERRMVAEEAKQDAIQQSEMQKEMEQASFGQQIASGQVPGGQAPGAQGQPGQAGQAQGMPPASPVMSLDPSVPVSPSDIKNQAVALAQQLYSMPEAQKDSELRQLKQKHELLHQQTKVELEKLRDQARMAGGEMIRQQMTGGA